MIIMNVNVLLFSLFFISCHALGDEASSIWKDISVEMATSWVKDIDPVLDEQLGLFQGGSEGDFETTASVTNKDDETLMNEMAKAFASPAGFDRARTLLEEDPEFRKFNDAATAEMQSELCTYLQMENAQASPTARSCICGETNDAFVACEALLEEEVKSHLVRRARERRELRHPSSRQVQEKALLGSCDATFGGSNGGSVYKYKIYE